MNSDMLIFGLCFGSKATAKLFNIRESSVKALLTTINPGDYKIAYFLQQCLVSATTMLETKKMCEVIDLSFKSSQCYIKNLAEASYYNSLTESQTEQLEINPKFLITHEGVTCEICGQKCFDKFKLKRHMLRHTDKPLFPCEFCDKQFSFRYTLTTHMRKHTGERPFKCGFKTCDFASTQRGNLKEHRKRKQHYITPNSL